MHGWDRNVDGGGVRGHQAYLSPFSFFYSMYYSFACNSIEILNHRPAFEILLSYNGKKASVISY